MFSTFVGMIMFGVMSLMTTKAPLLIGQLAYGTFMACEIAYYTYIYAKVERSKYQLVTGHTRSSMLTGRFVGSVLAQLLVSFGWMNYRELIYISVGCKEEFCSTCNTLDLCICIFILFLVFSAMFIDDICDSIAIGER